VRGVLNPEISRRAEALAREFAAAQPFRHVVIDDFLEAALCQRLIEHFPPFDSTHALNERNHAGGKAVFPDLPSLGPPYRAFDRLMQDRDLLRLIEKITGIQKLLYDPEYIGGGTHENLSNQELDTHVDFNYHPRTNRYRRLNLLLFLNPLWEPSWGGSLELLRNPWVETTVGVDFRSIVPLANRCVIFETSEGSWHGFPRINAPPGVSRRSIAVYFYTREAPAEGAAPSHATLYFQRPLPRQFQVGHTLEGKDIDELETLLKRRDGTIEFLYEREKEFTRALQSPVYRTAMWLTTPLRTIRRMVKRDSR